MLLKDIKKYNVGLYLVVWSIGANLGFSLDLIACDPNELSYIFFKPVILPLVGKHPLFPFADFMLQPNL